MKRSVFHANQNRDAYNFMVSIKNGDYYILGAFVKLPNPCYSVPISPSECLKEIVERIFMKTCIGGRLLHFIETVHFGLKCDKNSVHYA
jgi:hypothetical protein